MLPELWKANSFLDIVLIHNFMPVVDLLRGADLPLARHPASPSSLSQG